MRRYENRRARRVRHTSFVRCARYVSATSTISCVSRKGAKERARTRQAAAIETPVTQPRSSLQRCTPWGSVSHNARHLQCGSSREDTMRMVGRKGWHAGSLQTNAIAVSMPRICPLVAWLVSEIGGRNRRRASATKQPAVLPGSSRTLVSSMLMKRRGLSGRTALCNIWLQRHMAVALGGCVCGFRCVFFGPLRKNGGRFLDPPPCSGGNRRAQKRGRYMDPLLGRWSNRGWGFGALGMRLRPSVGGRNFVAAGNTAQRHPPSAPPSAEPLEIHLLRGGGSPRDANGAVGGPRAPDSAQEDTRHGGHTMADVLTANPLMQLLFPEECVGRRGGPRRPPRQGALQSGRQRCIVHLSTPSCQASNCATKILLVGRPAPEILHCRRTSIINRQGQMLGRRPGGRGDLVPPLLLPMQSPNFQIRLLTPQPKVSSGCPDD